jgi:predicted cupin superfamily sugar epimerase
MAAVDWAMDDTRAIIDRLRLQPHPEGGWYRETWRAAAEDGQRGAGTAILYLLAAGERSHWHRVDATEIWIFQAGAPLLLHTAADGGTARTTTRLGADVLADDQPQFTVAPWEWQAAQSTGAWSLMACVVVPAFDFAGFELAPPEWEPG